LPFKIELKARFQGENQDDDAFHSWKLSLGIQKTCSLYALWIAGGVKSAIRLRKTGLFSACGEAFRPSPNAYHKRPGAQTFLVAGIRMEWPRRVSNAGAGKRSHDKKSNRATVTGREREAWVAGFVGIILPEEDLAAFVVSLLVR